MYKNNYLDYLLYGAFLDDSRYVWDGRLSIEDYKNLPVTELSLREIVERLDEIIRASVKNLSAGAEKVGILLSGGIDSINILSYLARFLGSEKIIAYTWAIRHNSPEAALSRLAAEKYGVKNHRIIIRPEDYNYEYEKQLFIQELKKVKLPLNYRDVVPNIIIKNLVKEDGVGIMFNGMNADTLFLANSWTKRVYKISRLLNFFCGHLAWTPLELISQSTSYGAWKYALTDKAYRKRIKQLYREIENLKLTLQQKIIVMEELYTETPLRQASQRKLFEVDGIKMNNPYYDRSLILFALSVTDGVREMNDFGKYPLYELARLNEVPQEVVGNPKLVRTYGFRNFMNRKLHLPIWEEMLSNRTLRQCVDIDLAFQKGRDNGLLFDRLRSLHYFIRYVAEEK